MLAVDALEGFDEKRPDASAYRRVTREIAVAGGSLKRAWIYLGKTQYVIDAVPIVSGNWPRYVGARMSQIREWWREIDSVSGMHGSGS